MENITSLMRSENITHVYLGGEPVDLAPMPEVQPYSWEQSFRQWDDVYTRERVAELAR